MPVPDARSGIKGLVFACQAHERPDLGSTHLISGDDWRAPWACRHFTFMADDRRIAHIDMDAFFASCELSQYPELRGQPMVVAGHRAHAPRTSADGTREFSRLRDYVGRGVLTTATYEARALGVHSGMPAMKAARLAPDAVLLPVNFDLYRRY